MAGRSRREITHSNRRNGALLNGTKLIATATLSAMSAANSLAKIARILIECRRVNKAPS